MKKNVGYWVATGFVAFAMASGGVAYLLRMPASVDGVAELGYPAYLVTLLGIWKLLGAAALLAPRLPVLKEWAYAGILFDLTGASFSHAAVGNDIRHVLVPLAIGAVAVISWALRPPARRLASPVRENEGVAVAGARVHS